MAGKPHVDLITGEQYTAKNIKDFWRRWHISLSEWFRDYLYFPMGGSRKGNIYFHLAVVFLATGIWHGATWNFVLWGMWHGTFRIFEQWIERKGHNIMIKGAIQEGIKIVNMHALNIRAPKYIKQILTTKRRNKQQYNNNWRF